MPNLNVYALAMAFFCTGCTQTIGGHGLDRQMVRQIERQIATQMQSQNIPAVSIAVAIDNRLIWEKAYGMADVENSVAVTTDSLFRTASLDKWMSATAAMKLVERGDLELNQDVQYYCKTYPRKQWPLTVSHILNHSGGVRHYWGDNDETPQTQKERDALQSRIDREDRENIVHYDSPTKAVEYFAADPLLFEPGTQYSYSSHGYRLLGCVMEGATGLAYSEIMSRYVFDPAQMKSTRVDENHAVITNRIHGYSRSDEGELLRAALRDVTGNLPAGGHLATASDLVRFASAFNTHGLIDKKMMERMLAMPAYGTEVRGRALTHYGYGVRVSYYDTPSALKGHAVLSHNGSQAGTRTRLESVPDYGIVVAIMMNQDEAEAAALSRSIIDALVEKYH